MPTFDEKPEKVDLFEDLFQKNLKVQNQLTEEDKTIFFHYLMRGDALQTFKRHQPQQKKLWRNSDCVS